MCCLGDHVHEVARLVGIHRLARHDGLRLPRGVLLERLHVLVADADRVVRVLEEDRGIRRTIERRVITRVDQGPGFLLLLGLAFDELDDVRMVDVQDHHLRRAARTAAGLDDAGERVEPLHEGDRAGGGAAPLDVLLRGAKRGEVRARSRAPLEEKTLGLREVQDPFHRVGHGVDEARRALGLRLHAAVEPDRAVEGSLLVEEQISELVGEGLCVHVGREIALLPSPARDGVDHAADQLFYGVLTLRCSNLTTKILRRDHIRRHLRPELGELHVALLEDGLAGLARDDGGPELPFDLIEGVLARAREHPGEAETTLLLHAEILLTLDAHSRSSFHRCHAAAPELPLHLVPLSLSCPPLEGRPWRPAGPTGNRSAAPWEPARRLA